MSGECSAHGDDEKCIGPTQFWVIYMKRRDHFRDQGIYNIKTNLKGVRWEDVVSVCMAQDIGEWRGLVNAIMNVQVP
jgi:hypothetical protein